MDILNTDAIAFVILAIPKMVPPQLVKAQHQQRRFIPTIRLYKRDHLDEGSRIDIHFIGCYMYKTYYLALLGCIYYKFTYLTAIGRCCRLASWFSSLQYNELDIQIFFPKYVHIRKQGVPIVFRLFLLLVFYLSSDWLCKNPKNIITKDSQNSF